MKRRNFILGLLAAPAAIGTGVAVASESNGIPACLVGVGDDDHIQYPINDHVHTTGPGPTQPPERMRIDSTSNLGIGVCDPQKEFHIASSGNIGMGTCNPREVLQVSFESGRWGIA